MTSFSQDDITEVEQYLPPITIPQLFPEYHNCTKGSVTYMEGAICFLENCAKVNGMEMIQIKSLISKDKECKYYSQEHWTIVCTHIHIHLDRPGILLDLNHGFRSSP